MKTTLLPITTLVKQAQRWNAASQRPITLSGIVTLVMPQSLKAIELMEVTGSPKYVLGMFTSEVNPLYPVILISVLPIVPSRFQRLNVNWACAITDDSTSNSMILNNIFILSPYTFLYFCQTETQKDFRHRRHSRRSGPSIWASMYYAVHTGPTVWGERWLGTIRGGLGRGKVLGSVSTEESPRPCEPRSVHAKASWAFPGGLS